MNYDDPNQSCPTSSIGNQHVLAEHRELTRIPNAIAKGKFSLQGQPADYQLGERHIRFFFDKRFFLKKDMKIDTQNVW